MKSLCEKFNGFAEDYLVNLNESADAMYLNLCMRKLSLLINEYGGTIADITSSLDDVNLAGKLVRTVEKHNSSVSKRRVINMLEEAARHVLNKHAVKHIGRSYINILVDFDNIDYVVGQLKKDYPEYKNFFELDFEPYEEGLISVGFVIEVR